MRIAPWTVCLSLVLSTAAYGEERAAPLPQGLALEGRPAEHLRYSDKAGEHVLVVTLTDVKESVKDGETVGSRSLFGYHFTRDAKGGWTLDWRTKDFVTSCSFDLELALLPGSMGLSDVDQDGLKETRFAYRLGCRSDVSPLDLKLLFHEGKQKLAVRGTTRVYLGEEGGKPLYVGGEHTFDPAFAKAPKGLKELAQKEWARLSSE